MRLFFQVVSYIFHPLFIPLAGTIGYFMVTPKYSPIEVQSGSLLPIFILTVIIPIISYLILKNVGLISSIFITSIKERRYPLYIHISLLLIIIYKVLPYYSIVELHFYFIGLLIAAMSTLVLFFFNVKNSMHLMGMGSLITFFVGLSVHFAINITIALSLLVLVTGMVTTSRLYLKAHTIAEIAIGFSIGVLSQLLLFKFWL